MLKSFDQIQGQKLWGLILPLATLLALSLLLYSQVFGYDWTYDDFIIIVDNPDVRSFSAFWQDSYPGRPLRELTFLLDHHLFGMVPAGWHLQNLLWHGLTAFLLLCLVRALGASRTVAWGATLLFLCHPLQVEAVASISHRKESLALAFSLAAMLAYIVAPRKRRPWLWFLCAALLYLVACQAKQIAIMLPAAFFVYEVCYLPQGERLLFRYRWFVAGASFLAGIAGLIWFAGYGGLELYLEWAETLLIKMEYYGPTTVSTYLQLMFKSWAFMVLRIFYPVNLAVEYLYSVPQGWTDLWVVAGLLLPLVWLFGLFCLRRKPLLLFALFWVGLFWLPTSNIWPLAYPAADRYLYTPLAGVAILVAATLAGGRSSKLLGQTLLAVCLIACSLLTWNQVQHWQSDETVHQRALEVSPDSAFLHNELGKIYEKEGKIGRALEFYRQAAQLNPRNAAVQYNLGKILEQAGMINQALQHYARFLAQDNPAYRAAAETLRRRLKAQYGLKLAESPQ